MKKKGFTLIELLAVIVILAIIAVIATPMVLNTIDDARKGAAKSSATTYMKELETEVIKSMMTTNPIKAGKYKVGDIAVDVKGDAPTEGYVCVASDGTVEKASVLLNDYVISYNGKEATTTDADKVEEIDCGESYVVGDAVTIDGIGYHVIKKSSSTDEYVTLLRDESIGSMSFDENGGLDFETSTLKAYLDSTYKETFGDKQQYIQEITLLDFGEVPPYDESGLFIMPESEEEGTYLQLFINYRDIFFKRKDEPSETCGVDAVTCICTYGSFFTKSVYADHSIITGVIGKYNPDNSELYGYDINFDTSGSEYWGGIRPVIVISKKALD